MIDGGKPITVKTNDGKTYTFMVNAKNAQALINSVMNLSGQNDGVSREAVQNFAARSGDVGVLELKDLTPRELLEYFKQDERFSENFDISLSKDNKYYYVKFKNDYRVGKFKNLFHIPDGVLRKKENFGEIVESKWYYFLSDNRDDLYFKEGATLELHVNETHFTDQK